MKETIKFIIFIVAVLIMWFLAFGKLSIYQIQEPPTWPPPDNETQSLEINEESAE